ncbi:2-aminoadipate transaminase [compost metagenome]
MEPRFADRVAQMDASDIRQLMKIITDSSLISFGAGNPAKNLFPIEELKKANDLVYRDNALEAFQYSNSEGYAPLREWIADRHNTANQTHFVKDNILITNGSQQGLDLVGKILLNKGDIVLCESPTYTSALSAFRSYECEFRDVTMDSEGMILSEVEALITKHNNIKLIYIIPNYQNPTGTTWSLERRKAIAEIAAKNRIIIIEDDPYNEMGFDGSRIPSISKFDNNKIVITLGSFSKSLCPGLRIGWIIASEDILAKLIYAKQATDLQTNEIVQRQVYYYLKMYNFDEHLSGMREKYKHRCKIACDSATAFFPETVHFIKPAGGFFLWLSLPDHIDTKDLLPLAIQRGVAYVPGQSFYSDKSRHNNIRLNYSSAAEPDLVRGIQILGSLFNEVCS